MDKELKVPKLRFKDEDGREFPQWEKRRLGEVALNISSGKSQKCEDGKYSLYGSTGIIGNSREADYLGSKLIIARVGACGFCRFVTEPCGISDNALVITSNDYNYNLQWLYYCVSIKHLERYAIGTAQPLITGSLLKRINLLFPTLPEQRKIADFLTAYDELIDNQKKRVEVLKLRKKGLLQKIFSQEIRFKDDEGREFPKWEERRLGEVGVIIGGGTPSTENEKYWNGKINWLTPLEINCKYVRPSLRKITELGYTNSSAKLLPKGTVILTTRASVGLCSIQNTDDKFTTNQGFQSILFDAQRIYFEYGYYCLMTTAIQTKMKRLASGTTFLELSSSNLKKIKLPLPTLLEQRKIADFLSIADRQIFLEEKRLDTMRLIKKALLQQLFV